MNPLTREQVEEKALSVRRGLRHDIQVAYLEAIMETDAALRRHIAEIGEWKQRYLACHKLHLEAQAECEERNIFILQSRAIGAEQRVEELTRQLATCERETWEKVAKEAETFYKFLDVTDEDEMAPQIMVDFAEYLRERAALDNQKGVV